jgi:hypothetical protein
MPDYTNGKIYKLISPSHPELIYYGSTTKKYLSSRLAGHRCDYKNNINITSKEIMQYDDVIIVLVETFSCNNKNELLKKEYEYILNNPCINKAKGLNPKEYYQANKERIKVRSLKYYYDKINI